MFAVNGRVELGQIEVCTIILPSHWVEYSSCVAQRVTVKAVPPNYAQ